MLRSTKLLASLSLLAISTGCATQADPEARAWKEIVGVTDASYMGGDQLKLNSQKYFLMGIDRIEHAMLARAAGEALARGETEFVIRRAEYRQGFDLWRNELDMMTTRTIGSYVGLHDARTEQLSDVGRVKGLHIIVEFVEPDDRPYAPRFDAAETYEVMVNLWLDGQPR